MLAQWTGTVIGKLHIYQIDHKELAAKIGWNAKYLSVVLNGHKTPRGAEQKVTEALDQLIAERGASA